MDDNPYKVPKDQWRRWHELARHVFNTTYATMVENKRLFLHPRVERTPPADEHWKTTAWNASWIAADAVMGR